jgi:Trypsin-like peptidase domain
MDCFERPLRGYDNMDIAIPKFSTQGFIDFVPTQLAQLSPNVVPFGFVVNLENNCSGFIISKPRRKFIVGPEEVSALVLTAAHCVSSVCTKEFSSDIIPCCMEYYWNWNNLMNCTPIFNSLKDPEVDSVSSVNTKYMCPNDLALLILKGNIPLDQIMVLDTMEPSLDQKCFVSGYPYFRSTKYLYPDFSSHNKTQIKKKIKSTFNNFKGLINSFGTVSYINRDIVEVKCSTTAGMSGGPLLVHDLDNPSFSDLKIAGVYVGGPPIPIQYELLSAARLAIEQKVYPSDILTNIKNIFYNDYYPNSKLLREIEVFEIIISEYLNGTSSEEEIEEQTDYLSKKLLYCHPQLLLSNQSFYFNTCIPTTHPSFRKILDISQKFSSIDQNFTNIEEFKNFLV